MNKRKRQLAKAKALIMRAVYPNLPLDSPFHRYTYGVIGPLTKIQWRGKNEYADAKSFTI